MEVVDKLIEQLAERISKNIVEDKMDLNEAENVRALAELISARAQMN